MSEPIQIERDKTYVLEVDHGISNNQVREIIQTFKESTGSNLIVLSGSRLARVANEAEETLERVRELHKPTKYSAKPLPLTGCYECTDIADTVVEYPCSTIQALDGDK